MPIFYPPIPQFSKPRTSRGSLRLFTATGRGLLTGLPCVGKLHPFSPSLSSSLRPFALESPEFLLAGMMSFLNTKRTKRRRKRSVEIRRSDLLLPSCPAWGAARYDTSRIPARMEYIIEGAPMRILPVLALVIPLLTTVSPHAASAKLALRGTSSLVALSEVDVHVEIDGLIARTTYTVKNHQLGQRADRGDAFTFDVPPPARLHRAPIR